MHQCLRGVQKRFAGQGVLTCMHVKRIGKNKKKFYKWYIDDCQMIEYAYLMAADLTLAQLQRRTHTFDALQCVENYCTSVVYDILCKI